MERREFLATSAASLSVTVLGEEEVEASQSELRMTAESMADHLRDLDHGLANISREQVWFQRQVEALRPPGAPPLAAADAELARCEELSRKLLRGFMVVGSFRDLPEHGRAHPGMQSRLRHAMEESGEAVAELSDWINGISKADRMDLASIMQKSPEVFERMAAEIELGASRGGVSEKRREQNRKAMIFLQRHIKRHAGSVIFDEYLEQVEEVRRRPAAQQYYRELTITKMGEAKFAALEQHVAALAQTWANEPLHEGSEVATAPASPPPPAPPTPPPVPVAERPEPVPGQVVRGEFLYRITGDKVVVQQQIAGLPATVAVIKPPQPPRRLGWQDTLLQIATDGDAVLLYDVSDPYHPTLGHKPPAPTEQPVRHPTQLRVTLAKDAEIPHRVLTQQSPKKPANKSNTTSTIFFILTGITVGAIVICGIIWAVNPNVPCLITPLVVLGILGLIFLIVAIATRK